MYQLCLPPFLNVLNDMLKMKTILNITNKISQTDPLFSMNSAHNLCRWTKNI